MEKHITGQQNEQLRDHLKMRFMYGFQEEEDPSILDILQ